MAAPNRKRATYEELQALPSNVVGEIVGGVLHAQPRPSPRHALASSRLGAQLGNPFDVGSNGPGGWWILDEPELHLDDDVVVPDLAGWRRERMPSLPEAAFFQLAPDWVCEVLSPSTAALDRAEKMPIYAHAGVRHAWLIDPVARLLEVYRLESGRWVLLDAHRDAALVRAEPFKAIELSLAVLWG